MSGHNKWTQIKRQKGVEDAKKSKLFSLLAKTISVETKKSAGDKTAPGLRAAMEKARAANMPNDHIERAINNALGASGKRSEEVLYEAYGPGGVAILIEGITDNRNRTAQKIKHLLAEHGGNLAAPGSVIWAFQKSADGWQANTRVPMKSDEQEKLGKLLSALKDDDDVKTVSTNLCV